MRIFLLLVLVCAGCVRPPVYICVPARDPSGQIVLACVPQGAQP